MNNRYRYGLPAPHQGATRYGHPDSYTGMQATGNRPPAHNPYGNNTYGGGFVSSQQAYRGYQSHQRYAHQGFSHAPVGYYGNPTEIRVSDPHWVDALLDAMRQGQEIDLIFDAANIVDQLVEAVIEQVGSFTDIVARHAESVIDEFFSAGMANPNVPAHAMIAPVVAVALIAAILVVALAIIYAVVSIYNANASREIAEIAVNRGCEVVDIETTSSGSGSSGNGGGWFDFLNGSRWMIRCTGQ